MHDFEPGIAPSGLFWTIPVPKAAITVSPGSGTGSYAQSNLAVPDFHDFINAVSPNPTTVPGHVTFDVRWVGNGAHQAIRDETFGFTGNFVPSDVTIRFAVSDDGTGVTYTSDPGGQTSVGGIGHERNGVFFS